MKKLIRVLLIVLAVVIALAAVAGGTAWWYVARIFEEPPLPVVAAQTQRSVQGGDIAGYVDRADTYAWLGIPFAAAPASAGRPPAARQRECRATGGRPALAGAAAAGRLDGRAGNPGTGTAVSTEAAPGRWRGRRR